MNGCRRKRLSYFEKIVAGGRSGTSVRRTEVPERAGNRWILLVSWAWLLPMACSADHADSLRKVGVVGDLVGSGGVEGVLPIGGEASGDPAAIRATGTVLASTTINAGGVGGGAAIAGAPSKPQEADHCVSGLIFSKRRGFYASAFELTISHPTAQSVTYTLDASDPSLSPSAMSATLPVTIHLDPADISHRYLAPGVVVRAVPKDVPITPDRICTHTYLFLDKVVELQPDGRSPGGNWPAPVATTSGTTQRQVIDYGMDPEVAGAADYAALMVPALKAIPSVSLVTDLPNLFDSTKGIYVNAEREGIEWERAGSLELLNPDGSPGFQVNTGIRIRGGYSRIPKNPKHAFRLFFRKEYGAAKLSFRLFGAEGASSFDKVDLRTEQNYSWSGYGDVKNTMTRDVFSRDLQRALGRPYTRSRFYHLYLDGYYWGIFQTQERAEASFAETYLGGQKDDYDVVKVERESGSTSVVATDGTLDSWLDIWTRCQKGFASDADYYALEGKDANGQRNATLKVLVDIDNLIDYMNIIFYTGNFDAPVSSFLDNTHPNNFFTISSRVDRQRGFIFFAHDSEHSLMVDRAGQGAGIQENRVDIATVDHGAGLMTVSGSKTFHPQWLHHRLTENAKYRTRFAARARQLLEGQGPMTAAPAQALLAARTKEIELAIVAESARWGDAKSNAPRTKNGHFVPAVNRIMNDFFPARPAIVIGQLKAAGLYP